MVTQVLKTNKKQMIPNSITISFDASGTNIDIYHDNKQLGCISDRLLWCEEDEVYTLKRNEELSFVAENLNPEVYSIFDEEFIEMSDLLLDLAIAVQTNNLLQLFPIKERGKYDTDFHSKFVSASDITEIMIGIEKEGTIDFMIKDTKGVLFYMEINVKVIRNNNSAAYYELKLKSKETTGEIFQTSLISKAIFKYLDDYSSCFGPIIETLMTGNMAPLVMTSRGIEDSDFGDDMRYADEDIQECMIGGKNTLTRLRLEKKMDYTSLYDSENNFLYDTGNPRYQAYVNSTTGIIFGIYKTEDSEALVAYDTLTDQEIIEMICAI